MKGVTLLQTAFVLLIFTLFVSRCAQAQESSSSKDAMNTLLSVAKVNNLEQDGIRPWHIKATYEIFDMQGQSKGTGTYEEWWVNSKKNKHTFATDTFSRTDYFTDKGVFRVETGKNPGIIGPEQIKSLVRPLSEEDFDDFTPEVHDQQLGNVLLQCFTLTWNKDNPVVPISHLYCVDHDHLALRTAITEYGFYEKLYNNIVRLGDQYIAKNISVMDKQRPVTNIKVDQIENLVSINEADFTPPSSAEKLAPGLTGFGVVTGTREQYGLHSPPPQYPEAARQTRLEGEVAIKVVIDKNGRVMSPEFISGSSVFKQSALDAVKQWEFRPFVANHEPVGITSEIKVQFHLSK